MPFSKAVVICLDLRQQSPQISNVYSNVPKVSWLTAERILYWPCKPFFWWMDGVLRT